MAWKCHAEYATATVAGSPINEARRREGPAAVAALYKGRIVSGAEVEAALEDGGDIHAASVILREAKEVDWSGCAPWTVVCRSGRVDILKWALSQPSLVPLVNRGYPLRIAAVGSFHEGIEALLELPETDPNHGCPLFFSVSLGDLAAVKMFGSHPRTAINAFCPSRGTTPLCQAVLCGAEDVFCYLVAHPRIDVNRGFLLTPLQHCVAEGRVSFAKALLSRPSVLINKCVGASSPPVWMALEGGGREMATLLLKDSRSAVTETMIDEFEIHDQVEALQLISDVEGSSHVGKLWRRRRTAVLLSFMVHLICGLADTGALVTAGIGGLLPTLFFCLVVIHLTACIGSAALLALRASADKQLALIRAVPLIPLYLFVLLLRIVNVSHAGALVRRSAAFSIVVRDSTLCAIKSLAIIAVAVAFFQSWSAANTTVVWMGMSVLSHVSVLCLAAYLRVLDAPFITKGYASGYHRIV